MKHWNVYKYTIPNWYLLLVISYVWCSCNVPKQHNSSLQHRVSTGQLWYWCNKPLDSLFDQFIGWVWHGRVARRECVLLFCIYMDKNICYHLRTIRYLFLYCASKNDMICLKTSVSESWINEKDTVFCVRSDQDQGERSLKSLSPPPEEAQLNPGLSCRLSELGAGPGQIVHNNRHLKQRTVKHCHLQLVIYGSHQSHFWPRKHSTCTNVRSSCPLS